MGVDSKLSIAYPSRTRILTNGGTRFHYPVLFLAEKSQILNVHREIKHIFYLLTGYWNVCYESFLFFSSFDSLFLYFIFIGILFKIFFYLFNF